MTENIMRIHVIIRGRVQGVWFRASTERMAVGLGLSGWVRNQADGSVEAVFEGPPYAVDAALAWAHDGPEHAHVDDVVQTAETPEGLTGFDIR